MNRPNINQLYLKDTSFANLMQKRVFNVLLVASRYDAFIMEEDGRVEEQIYFEYVSLNLSSPPRVKQVTTNEEAFEELAMKRYDLIITMPGVDCSETFTQAKAMKRLYPYIPIVVLTPFSHEVSRRIAKEDLSGVDYVFSWLGNVDLLVAIIKLIEDKMNAEVDITSVGVQLILLVEDSIRFYSSILPHLYNFVLKQSQIFSTEALNEHERMLRMRGRPKVMLARTYEEAMQIYEKYSGNMLGIISDVSFIRAGVKDKKAGIKFGYGNGILSDKVIGIDQSPIGRTPRSNPATYTGVFSDIRNLFVNLPEAKIRGYKPGRFSFNVTGGRCEACGGNGYKTIEMNFLPDVLVPCEVCHGKRYNRETLEVRFKGKSIADVLDMTINRAVEFFENVPQILNKIKVLQEVGLGYIKLGQPSTTLSGGESQRVKLATELSKRDTGKTLYILDEPTTGLHFEDIRVLMTVLNRLVDKGNTVIVIEHNLDVIKLADYIIDMGPEGGRGGGQLLSTGTPEEVAKSSKGYTPRFIKEELKN